MNRHALDVLQFADALRRVAGHATSGPGAEAVLALTPSDSPAWITEELHRVDEMLAFITRANEAAVPPIPDLRAALDRLAVSGSVWDAPTVRDAGVLMRSSRLARQSILKHAQEHALLVAVAGRLAILEDTEEAIRRAVDDAGEVRDTASRELARLRKEMRGARGRIVEKLEQFIATLPAKYQVGDASISVREGRYVIPIRREGRGDVGGLVHDESATGQTLFVEPPIAIELMNRLRELEIAESREVQRILRELTDGIRPHHAALDASLEALIEIDTLWARARYASDVDGHRPEIGRADARACHVVRGRHPLLIGGELPVVPFDLDLGADERTMLVSGPNTGGKTVLLKAMGLINALAQAGVIPPVGEGTRLPVFTDIFADIGDEQSIEASLSTFSAHLRNLREILERAGADSLVLIDEIGSGTDPVEGAALARAVLIELSRRGALTIATTHLGELKRLAAEEAGVVNASLQFDAAVLRPTYQLRKGVPGRSYGIAIARRLGFPDAVLERAEKHVPASERDLGSLLEEIEAKERAADEALAAATRARTEAEALERDVRARAAELEQRERVAGRQAKRQARELLLAAREEVEGAIRQLKTSAAASSRDIEEASRAARQRVEQRVAELADTPTGRTATESGVTAEIRVGTRVRIGATGAEGMVVELREDRALVETRGVRLQVPALELIAIDAPAEQPARTASRPSTVGGWSGPDFDPASEIDLRGLRADEMSTRLQPAIDAAVQAALPSLRIIHGKGTGALRQVVAELLKADARVARFRAGGVGEGGSGVTVAELR
ncbi:MAG: endonuclease MutS2 [Gemmatimonadetes bacterium]|nr:endonuclease MutS2 [Gemmatimonadota bacterium]